LGKEVNLYISKGGGREDKTKKEGLFSKKKGDHYPGHLVGELTGDRKEGKASIKRWADHEGE